MEWVILVDEKDNQIGTEEKLKAHQEGKLHRAFSVFIFNSKGELLLQQRALTKYHCPGLWSNTVCSHPRPGEMVEAAAHRRMQEELGFDGPVKEVFSFVYKVKFSNGLTEHEFDHVLVGKFEPSPCINSEEVAAVKWVSMQELKDCIKKNPEKYSYWLRVAISDFESKLTA